MNRWIIPSNLKRYDVISAFHKLQSIDWTQRIKGVEVGDVIYIYIGAPISAIKYSCKVTAINIKKGIDELIDDNEFVIDSAFNNTAERTYMRLKKECEFDNELTFAVLKEHGWKGSVQGARAVPSEIASYIDDISKE